MAALPLGGGVREMLGAPGFFPPAASHWPFFFQGRFGASCKVSGGALAFKEWDLFRTGEVPAGDFLDPGGPGTL